MNTAILKCSKCTLHEFQDQKYGHLMRVHNRAKAGWRCTVCLAMKPLEVVKAKEEKK